MLIFLRTVLYGYSFRSLIPKKVFRRAIVIPASHIVTFQIIRVFKAAHVHQKRNVIRNVNGCNVQMSSIFSQEKTNRLCGCVSFFSQENAGVIASSFYASPDGMNSSNIDSLVLKTQIITVFHIQMTLDNPRAI